MRCLFIPALFFPQFLPAGFTVTLKVSNTQARCGLQTHVKQLPPDRKYFQSCSLTPGRTSVFFTRTRPADLGSIASTGCGDNRRTGAGMCFWPTWKNKSSDLQFVKRGGWWWWRESRTSRPLHRGAGLLLKAD